MSFYKWFMQDLPTKLGEWLLKDDIRTAEQNLCWAKRRVYTREVLLKMAQDRLVKFNETKETK